MVSIGVLGFLWERCGLLWYIVAVSVRVAARISDALAERIVLRASVEMRSLSNMIERLLELGLGQVVTDAVGVGDSRLGADGQSLGVESTVGGDSVSRGRPASVTVCPNVRFHRSGTFCKQCGRVP